MCLGSFGKTNMAMVVSMVISNWLKICLAIRYSTFAYLYALRKKSHFYFTTCCVISHRKKSKQKINQSNVRISQNNRLFWPIRVGV